MYDPSAPLTLYQLQLLEVPYLPCTPDVGAEAEGEVVARDLDHPKPLDAPRDLLQEAPLPLISADIQLVSGGVVDPEGDIRFDRLVELYLNLSHPDHGQVGGLELEARQIRVDLGARPRPLEEPREQMLGAVPPHVEKPRIPVEDAVDGRSLGQGAVDVVEDVAAPLQDLEDGDLLRALSE